MDVGLWEPKWGFPRFPTKTDHLQCSWRKSSNPTLKLKLCFLCWFGPYILDDEIHYVTWQRSPTAAVWAFYLATVHTKNCGILHAHTSSLQIMQMIHRHLRLVTLSLIVLEVLLWRHDVELSLRAVAWCQGRSHSQSVRLLGVHGQGRRDHQVTGTLEKSWWSMVPSFPGELGTEFVVWKPPKFCSFSWCELPNGLFAKGCINSKAWFDSTWSRKKRVKRKHDAVIWWVQWVYQHLTTWWFVLLSLLFSEHPFLEALFTSWERCNSWAKVSVASCVLAAADSLDI